MLGNLENLSPRWYNDFVGFYKKFMPRNSAYSADNQQERLKTIGWIVGYVDGEGCFSVSVCRNTK